MLIKPNATTVFSPDGQKSSEYVTGFPEFVADFPVRCIAPASEFDFLSTLGSEKSQEFKTIHSGLIYDISFDSEKRRLATCSADQTVLIWTLDESGQWVHDSTIREHNGSTWKVTWADSKFGQILATCSFDNKRSRLFEAVPGDHSDPSRKRWVPRNTFEDKLSNIITDVKFAPAKLGLILGLCSIDGSVQLLEAEETDLRSWRELASAEVRNSSLSCLAFSESTSNCNGPTSNRRDRFLIATGADFVRSDDVSTDSLALKNISHLSLFYVDDTTVDRKVTKTVSLVPMEDSKLLVDSPVRCCCFAPTLGRSFQLLAIGCKNVIVFQMKSEVIQSRKVLDYPPDFKSDTNNVGIWRLAWNVTGTQIVASTTHGNVFVWQSNDGVRWRIVKCCRNDSLVYVDRGLGDPKDVSPAKGKHGVGVQMK